MKSFEDYTTDMVPTNTNLFTEEGGISMSEAQSLAEKAKNLAQIDERQLDSTGPYTRVMKYRGEEVKIDQPEILSRDELMKAANAGRYYGLVAYLRESLKAKQAWLGFLQTAPIQLFSEEDYPEQPQRPRLPKQPVLEQYDLEDVKRNLTPEELAKYSKLEAETAHLGQRIHPSQKGDRDNVIYHIAHAKPGTRFETKTMREQGGYTEYPVSVEPRYTQDYPEEVYIELHDQHRDMEKSLNWYKAKFKNELSDLTREANRKYAEEMEAHQAEVKKLQEEYEQASDEYTQETRRINALARERQEAEINRVSKLGIVVPEVLKDLLREVRETKDRG